MNQPDHDVEGLRHFSRNAEELKAWDALAHKLHYDRTHGKATMLQPSDATVDVIRRTLNKGQLILLVGGPSGCYGQRLQRDQRFRHYISTESHGRKDNNFHLQPTVGCVLVSRYIDASLTRTIIDQCKSRMVPCFGTFRSTGGVQRTVEIALALPPLPSRSVPGDTDLEEDEAAADRALQQVDRSLVPPEKPEHLVQADRILHKLRNGDERPAPVVAPTPPLPAATPQIAEIRQLFADARAAVDLAEEAVVKVLTDNAQSLKAMARLQKIADLMKEDT